MEDKLVSIIVPVYNVEQYLRRCIESLLSQTYHNFELILVDDGSTDSSGAICDEYALADERIHVIHKPNGGVSSARNAGIDAVKGEYILFVDSDDRVEPQHISNMIPLEDEDLVRAGFKRMKNGVISDEQQMKAKLICKDEWIKDFQSFWLENPLWFVWGGCYRSKVIKENNLYFDKRINLSEDVIFNLSYLNYCQKIRISAINTYCYEDGDKPNSLVHKYCPARVEIERIICDKIEAIAGKKEYRIRWFNWHLVLQHLSARKNGATPELKREISKKIDDCFSDEFFRECIPFIREMGTLDEKIESYFMHAFLHPMYRPCVKCAVLLSRIKRICHSSI